MKTLLFLVLLVSQVNAQQIDGFSRSSWFTAKKMIEVAKAVKGDVVYDLGSGDGRIVVAAGLGGAQGIGIEIDKKLVNVSRQYCKQYKLPVGRCRIIQDDFFKVNIRDATVVTLFHNFEATQRLRPKLFEELKPGTRIVSNASPLFGWKNETEIHIDQVVCAGKECLERPLYLYVR